MNGAIIPGVGIETVEPPTSTTFPAAGSEIGVPEMVTAWPPGNSVWVPIMRFASGSREKEMPFTVNTSGAGVILGTGISDPSITMADPEGDKETGVPEMVTAWPAGISVWVPIMILELGSREKEMPIAVNLSGAGVAVGGRPGTGVTDPPTTMAVPEGDKEIEVPDMVIALAPGVIVCVPMTKPGPEP